MLVVHADGRLEHRHVRDLPEYLGGGDALVMNDTKVIPARLHGRRAPRLGVAGEGPKIEVLLHKRLAPNKFAAFALTMHASKYQRLRTLLQILHLLPDLLIRATSR